MGDIEQDALGKGNQGINSKLKGNKNELLAAKFMSSWTGVKFARTPGSGGLRWVNTAAVCGDITCEDQDYMFPYTVEVKAYKTANLLLTRSNTKIFTFWSQAEEDAVRANKEPMLLVRVNGMPKGEFIVYVSINPNQLDAWGHSILDLVVANRGGLIAFKSTDLLQYVKFSTFVKYLNN